MDAIILKNGLIRKFYKKNLHVYIQILSHEEENNK